MFNVVYIYDPFLTRTTTISEKNSLMTPFFYSVRTFVRIRQHYFYKYWGDGCMGRPHLKCWGTVPPVPPRSPPPPLSEALIAPRLKKQSLPRDDPSSYRPISNLSTLSKLLERIVSVQLTDHLTSHDLLPKHQSAYRRFHSTETALLKVYTDLVEAMDGGIMR